MKHSADDGVFQSNLLQAFQKNKIIQNKLTECQHVYYIQLVKDLEIYNLQEKYNRELLYTWKKESYIRQLKKDLQEYERQRFGMRDDYYENQLKTLDNVIAGEQTLVIPPSEEKRRLDVNAKYHQFLQKNPLQTLPFMRVNKSANISFQQNTNNKNEEEEEEEEVHSLEKTWEHIHAQSARFPRQRQNTTLPTIHRSLTMNEIRKNRASAKSYSSSIRDNVSNAHFTQSFELINTSFDEKIQQSPRSPARLTQNHSGLSDGIEPLLITSETLDKYSRADLVSMRSVRRPRKNPSDLNLLFETRKRIYQINRRALDHELDQRKRGLQKPIQFDQLKQIDLTKYKENLLVNVNENTETPSNDKH
ncbi:unnamed protein product [Rotaria sp. Silwood2]|nr:unnamed protein product [Rotaria sp. Silwood2]CAF3034259.1 unnamed protein product [Rotaria sp. Silwood2]CAF3948402.1 unnamed protein product [Rotaria sp. Silwood2]CAF3989685.1 unnamed protein product [Rotaria sp. Silwood2]CAF4045626.1 unnamed protein product [Rotaria sp. Silwood2]